MGNHDEMRVCDLMATPWAAATAALSRGWTSASQSFCDSSHVIRRSGEHVVGDASGGVLGGGTGSAKCRRGA